MLCERCKIREANIQYTEIVNGVKKEHNYCAQCAKEMDFGPYSAIFEGEFPLGILLSGLLGINEAQKEEETCQVVCPTCNTTYDEFVKNSRFGCPDCYGVFDLLISDNIKQMQGNDTHKGKRPVYQQSQDVLSETAKEVLSLGENHVQGREISTEDDLEINGKTVQGRDEQGRDAQNRDTQGHTVQDIEEQLRILEARLKEAIKQEEYEKAAAYRDQIKELREGKER